MKKILFSLLISSFQTVFANPYMENYEFTEEYEDIRNNKDTIFLKSNEKVTVQYINGVEEYYDYLSKGYIALGYSTFVSNSASNQEAIEQAKKVKAPLVLILKTVLDQSVNINDVQKKSTTQLFYNFDANFMALDESYKKTTLGIIFRDLPHDLVKKHERNTGVLVSLVYINSPAYRSNILRNDLITQINGRDVWKDNFMTILNEEKSTNPLKFTVIRDSTSKIVPVTLGW
ncbi:MULTISPECIES: S1C family serine protease [unclassified Acinetobacter]|uniref:S1C family serine protease n=1 Tax=unclassified Acinetobacter TaxID=196816 RepID=UPI0015D317F7|nr:MULTISPECIES: S1C family serine protease [unclassified Acinetobacter]